MKSAAFLVLAYAHAQSNVTVTEIYSSNNLKVDVYTKTWEPTKGNTVAKMVFVHGFNDMSSHYNDIFSKFAEAGIKVHAFDQVGCGKTGERANKLGGAMGMDRVRIDIDDAIERIYDTKTPLFLMGHSFGGSTVIDYLARGNKRDLIYGAIASCTPNKNVANFIAPAFELAPESQPGDLAIDAIRGLAFLTPNVKVHFPLGKPSKLNKLTDGDVNSLSRNKTYVEERKKESLQTSLWASIQVRDFINGGKYILDGGYKKIKISRVLIAHGSGDRITNRITSEKVAQLLSRQDWQKTDRFKMYPEAYHELHNDVNKDEVIAYYIKWILGQIGTKPFWKKLLPRSKKS
ncbi:hypothetical protein DSO57_1009685 [Entomophthora muscae]|uniref:Uncharacterized protein n=1 Tax=Entomophthora muscae TaxID=34485 RepID=A0ACC2THN3_9FUNG|nr:hypothetical protein DSO57_1009685 [Entomophthora muscae]